MNASPKTLSQVAWQMVVAFLGYCKHRWCIPDLSRIAKFGMITAAWLAFVCLASSSYKLQAEVSSVPSAQETLSQAVAAYQQALEVPSRTQRLSQFSQAEQLFRQCIQQSLEAGQQVSADLYTALGNAALQAEHVGPAIVAFRRALLAAPSHSQAAQNLAYARSTLPDWIQFSTSAGLTDTLFFWQSLYSRKAISAVAACCFAIGMLLLSISIVKSSRVFRYLAVAPILAWCLLAATQWLASGGTGPIAVVISDETILRSADSTNASPRMTEPLPSGAELHFISERDRWTEVEVNGRTGWLLKSTVEIVSADG